MDRKYPAAPIVCVGSTIFRNKKILLVKRANKPHAEHWTLPGGKVEVGESVQQALHREIKEECGIEINIKKLVDVIDYIEKDGVDRIKFHYTIIDFESTYVSGEIMAASDVKEAGWFALEQIPGLEIPEITKSFFQKHYQISF